MGRYPVAYAHKHPYANLYAHAHVYPYATGNADTAALSINFSRIRRPLRAAERRTFLDTQGIV